MRLVDRLVLKEIRGPFILGAVLFTSVFFAGSYLLKLTGMVMNGLPVLDAITIVFLYLPNIVPYTLPMTTLLAVLLGMGRLSQDSEVVSLFACGISIYRIAVPVIMVGAVVSISAILLNEVVGPWATQRNQELQEAVIESQDIGDKPFTIWDDSTKSLVRVNKGLDRETGTLRDITVVTHNSMNKPTMIMYAEKAKWAGMEDADENYKWRLIDGYTQTVGDDSPSINTFGETNTFEIKINKTPDQLALYQKDIVEMSFSEISRLLVFVRSHPDRPLRDIHELEVTRWNKLSLPMSSLVFALIAAPLGIRPQRSSSSVGLGLSVVLIILYWVFWHYTSQLAIRGQIDPFTGAFAANFLGLVASAILLRKSAK